MFLLLVMEISWICSCVPQWSLFWGVLWLRTFSELFPEGMSAGLAKCSFHVLGMQTGWLSSVHLYTLCWSPA